jgi:mannose-6-phosphate isomerase-like protein (cupin superfamily)
MVLAALPGGPIAQATVGGSPPGMSAYAIVDPDEVADVYEGSDVPGEFRPLADALRCEQLAVTLIRVPPHSDFEQGTGHYHDEVEELYLVTRGTLTMRFADDIHRVSAGAAVRVAAHTPRSHRNEGDEPVELWAISRRVDRSDATKVDAFWAASPDAEQHRGGAG